MQNKYLKITYYLLLITFPLIISAYTFLQPLPGLEQAPGESLLANYLSWLFRFALAAAAFLAVLQITIGGIQMIFGGASETARSNAKARIQDAIFGLLLALGSYLILATISSQFTDMKLDIPEIKMTVEKPPEKGPPGLATWPPPGPLPRGTYLDDEARTKLALEGIGVNKSDCYSGLQTNCTSLYGIPQSTVDNLIDLKNASGKEIVITGGTEPGHQTHGIDKPIIDIRYDKSLISSLNSFMSSGKITSYICEQGTIKTSCDGSGLIPDHFHVVFND